MTTALRQCIVRFARTGADSHSEIEVRALELEAVLATVECALCFFQQCTLAQVQCLSQRGKRSSDAAKDVFFVLLSVCQLPCDRIAGRAQVCSACLQLTSKTRHTVHLTCYVDIRDSHQMAMRAVRKQHADRTGRRVTRCAVVLVFLTSVPVTLQCFECQLCVLREWNNSVRLCLFVALVVLGTHIAHLLAAGDTAANRLRAFIAGGTRSGVRHRRIRFDRAAHWTHGERTKATEASLTKCVATRMAPVVIFVSS